MLKPPLPRGGLVRRRTTVILASSLLAVVLGLQAVELLMRAAVNRWLEQGIAVPLYGRILLGVAFFWAEYKWLLALPIIMSFFLIKFFMRREAKNLS
jgi:type II secretory pathway component PulF